MTLQAFTAEQQRLAKLYLATTVAGMMGRKFEEDDWAKVYAAAKGFKTAAWSNFDVDVMNGNLGVEHKMYGQDGVASLLETCGRSFMHPAGTRALRFPSGIEDATEAARDVLHQYGQKIRERTATVEIINSYYHSMLSRPDAIKRLMKSGMGREKAMGLIPEERAPAGSPDEEPDMRFGWLLWRRDLAEFLYFEQAMLIPRPSDFVGEWHERVTRGRRLPSRNLWIFRRATGVKEYSITNVAGVKVQPYFTVPLPSDPNLYHFRVQGEPAAPGLVRVWLTQQTARSLRATVGDLSPGALGIFVERRVKTILAENRPARDKIEAHGEEVLVPTSTYQLLRDAGHNVSDEYAFRLLLGDTADPAQV